MAEQKVKDDGEVYAYVEPDPAYANASRPRYRVVFEVVVGDFYATGYFNGVYVYKAEADRVAERINQRRLLPKEHA